MLPGRELQCFFGRSRGTRDLETRLRERRFHLRSDQVVILDDQDPRRFSRAIPGARGVVMGKNGARTNLGHGQSLDQGGAAMLCS